MSARLFLHVMSMEARRRMSYRVDFWINAVVGFAVQFAVVWFLWQAMYTENGTDSIAGFSFDDVLVYYVVVILVARLVRGSEFEGQPSEDIYAGGLNRYLLFPAPYFGLKYAQSAGSLLPAAVQAVLFGGGWWLATGGRGMEDLTLASAAMAVLALVLANMLYYVMAFCLHLVAFWADNVWSLIVALRMGSGLLGGLMFPLALFPDGLRQANDWLPFRCLFALPAETLLGRTSFEAWLAGMTIGLGWLVALSILARAIWRRGNLQYSGIGI